MKWAGTVMQIVGVFGLSSRLIAPSGAFAIMLIGSALWVAAAWRTRDWAAFTLNLAFLASNIIGIARWAA